METYQIQPPTRQCHASGRVLQVGDKYFSVLVEEGGRLVRRDYAADAWQGPPTGAFSYWAGRVPPDDPARKARPDDEGLFACLRQTEGTADPKLLAVRYVIALLLMRGKRLRMDTSYLEGDVEILRFIGPRTGELFEVVNRRLTDDEMAAVREEVARMVG
jgi:hypothetical protein